MTRRIVQCIQELLMKDISSKFYIEIIRVVGRIFQRLIFLHRVIYFYIKFYFFSRLTSVQKQSKAKVLVKHGDESDRSDKYIAPHVLEADKDDAFMNDEIFGPFLPILAMNDFDEALEFIRSGEKPLAAYLFTNDEKKNEKFLQKISAGGITLNDVQTHISVKSLPFGGVGNSGLGRYNGKYGFDTFTHEKSVVKRKI